MTDNRIRSPAHRRDLLVMVNPAAGSAEQEQVDAALSVLRDGADVAVAKPRNASELDAVLERLDDRALVVAGGDGSLHLAVERLRSLGLLPEVAVGLLPLGTGNDFARGLGLPLEAGEAARALLLASPAACDLLVDDAGGVVVNAVHAGLGAAAAARSEGLKGGLGPLAYPVGALIAGVAEGGYELEIAVDASTLHTGPTLMVGVGNATCIGGGTTLCPAAVPDDGLLDVIVATGVTPSARLAFGAALRQGTHTDRDDVLVAQGRSVTVRGDPVMHDADGELSEPLTERTYTVEPAAWRLLRP
ncbi:YegS/Rv2252/BmrU family lipid kinase [soil metagenome]